MNLSTPGRPRTVLGGPRTVLGAPRTVLGAPRTAPGRPRTVPGRRRATVAVAILAVAIATTSGASAPPNIRVAVEFREASVESRDAVASGGRLIITERGNVRAGGGVGVDSRQTRIRQSTAVFTVVANGGEAMLTMASEVPYPQVAFFQDYATGRGYVASAVVFQRVGTSFKVGAATLADGRIRVRVTPTISYFAADGSGTVELTDASTEIVVRNGQPVVIAGGSTQVTRLTREILGLGQATRSANTTVLLTATVE
jgi:Bacterial type II and III secretion system protein